MFSARYRFSCPDEAATLRLAAWLGARAWPGLVLTLEGPLGAGKTVFARGFAAGLGIEEPITSPSYPIIQQYSGRLDFHHMDWYRLGGEDEVMETGAAELLDSPGVSLVEWPDRAPELFDAETIRLSLFIGPGQERTVAVSFSAPGPLRRLGWPDAAPPGLIPD
jgi:tRNA threonylcarbamoyladenosine biosynthesis protein TsaE